MNQIQAIIFHHEPNPMVKASAFPPEEEQIGDTRYDDQANASIQNRIYLYDDGTIGAAWTRALVDGTWTDRGTGYNYFDGNLWGEFQLLLRWKQKKPAGHPIHPWVKMEKLLRHMAQWTCYIHKGK